MIEDSQQEYRAVDLVEDDVVRGLHKFAMDAAMLAGELSWFRGHRKQCWTLVPDIFRRRRYPLDETRITKKFRLRAPARYQQCPSSQGEEASFNWLSLMRHYGLPTRLLDWTRSILVAAYFAVAKEGDDDSAIWALGASNLYTQSTGDKVGMILVPGHDLVRGSANNAFKATGGFEEPLPVSPTEFDLRMLTQQSLFTIHGCDDPLEKQTHAGGFLMKLRIPQEARESLRLALRVLGVTRASVFPDLESLAFEIVDDESLWKIRKAQSND